MEEIIGYNLSDMASDLTLFDAAMQEGESVRLRLCLEALPTQDELDEFFLAASDAGHHLEYPSSQYIKGIPTVDIVITKGSPLLVAIIPLIGTLATIGLIVYGIYKLGDISRALIPLVLATGFVLVVALALATRRSVTEPAAGLATRYLERRPKVKYLPSVQPVPDREKLRAEIRELWRLASQWEGIPSESKFVVFSENNPFIGQYNDAVNRYMEMSYGGEFQAATIRSRFKEGDYIYDRERPAVGGKVTKVVGGKNPYYLLESKEKVPFSGARKIEWATRKEGRVLESLQGWLKAGQPPVQFFSGGEKEEVKFLPKLKAFDPYLYARFVLENNMFSASELDYYSGKTAKHPHGVPNEVWQRAMTDLDGKWVKSGQMYVLSAGKVQGPPDMVTPPMDRMPATLGRVTREEVEVSSWEERDRLAVWVTDKRTGKAVAEWWDDDARQMFEDGFFKPGKQLEDSVLDYAEWVGLLAKESQPAVIPAAPLPLAKGKRDELEFIADSPEYLSQTIEDTGWRDRIDEAFQTAVARVASS